MTGQSGVIPVGAGSVEGVDECEVSGGSVAKVTGHGSQKPAAACVSASYRIDVATSRRAR